MHVPVMPGESLEYLDIRRDGVYLDATTGLGGHTAAIAQRLAELSGAGYVLACDRDAESLALARANTAELASRIRFRQSLFSELEGTLAAEGISQLDGLLADLGVSRYQLTESRRGFSFMSAGPLDMRMSRDQERTAADIVNRGSEKDIADLIFRLGEERRSRKISRAIVRARPITTTDQLAKLIEGVVPRTGKLHPATQTFMALRIAVNRELEELDALLASLPRLIKPGGRAVILSFMSLEDRRIKFSFQAMAKSGRARLLTRHVVRPTDEEIRDNPLARSAKLRAVELL
jgi:16S rRNA (cytosine1402-N4)-methyltransferase